MTSTLPRWFCRATPLALPVFAALAVSLPVSHDHSASPPLPHPHFAKRLEVKLSDLEIHVTHITVPFNAEKAAELKAGDAWHLGNAHLELTADVKIGGVDVPAGKYSVKARKTEDAHWELVLDAPSRFSRKLSDDAKPLKTHFAADHPDFEHLSLDIHPAGDKDQAKLFLDVRFHTQLARVEIVLPE